MPAICASSGSSSQLRGYDWSDLGLEELGDFAGWLRSPAENVVVLAGGDAARQASTVNRKLAAVAAFYDFHHRQSGGGGG